MVDVKELKAFREADPFRPFEILLDDGRRVLIRRPWNVAWSAVSQMLVFPWGREGVDWVKFARVKDIRAFKRNGSNRAPKRRGQRP